MKILKKVSKEMGDHAKKDAPLEACGYLASKDGIIMVSYPLANIDKSSEHFSFDPKEQITVVRNARAKGMDISAVYHSHPSSPARPSVEDIKLAHDPDMVYVIVSLAGSKEDIRAFEIKNDKVTPVKLELINDEKELLKKNSGGKHG